MKRKLIVAAVAVCMSLPVGSVAAQAAVASGSDGETSRATLKNATQSLDKYGDVEMLELLLAAQGPIAEDHPELKTILGFSESKPKTNEDALAKIISAYLAANPDFNKVVSLPFQSGDPDRVDEALRSFSKTFGTAPALVDTVWAVPKA